MLHGFFNCICRPEGMCIKCTACRNSPVQCPVCPLQIPVQALTLSMEKLEYQISINASPKHVWETMLAPDTYREWVAASWPGSLYQGHWGQNEEIRFIGESGAGTLARINTYHPYELIEAEHIAILLAGGERDTGTDMAQSWVGTTEDYHFEATDGGTLLTVNMGTGPEWAQMFNDGWPKALAQLKAICER